MPYTISPAHSPGDVRNHTRYGVLAFVWLALIVYGSLLPFRLKPPPWAASAGFWQRVEAFVTAPRWEKDKPDEYSSLGVSHQLSDTVVNLALYAPLGLLLRLALSQRRWPLAAQIGVPIMVAAAVSWSVECTQSVIEWRVSSINDFVNNTAGAAGGAAVAVWLRRAGVWLVFEAYCRCAPWLARWRGCLSAMRERPLLMFVVVAANVALVLCGCARVAVWAGGSGRKHAPAVNVLPFAEQFSRSWDVAALQIGSALVVYMLLAMLLSLQFLSLRQRRGVGWVVLGAAMLAGLREVGQVLGTRPHVDLTEPVMAVMAVAGTVATAVLLRRAVQAACRRKQPLAVIIERRRVPHEY